MRKGDNRVSGGLGKEVEASRAMDDWAREFGVPLSDPVRDALLKFARLLLAWGQRINLTAAKSVEAVARDQLPDAFAVAGRLALRGGGSGGAQIVDVGSGGGLPAIPLALLRPQDELTMMEATGKKVAFLRTAVRELGLGQRIAVEQRRIDLRNAGERQFDVAMSRAMLAPKEWLTLGCLLVRPGGTIFSLGVRELTDWPSGVDLVHQAAYQHRAGRYHWVAELKRST
jgi:16S rRNA (guanine527-N7)-methyltransferase